MTWKNSLLVCLVALLAGGVVAQEESATLLVEASDGEFAMEQRSSIQIQNLTGAISVRIGREPVVRFACRTLDNQRSEHPVTVWDLDGSALLFESAEGDEALPLLLQVTVPPDADAVVLAANSRVQMNGVTGDAYVEGAALEVDLRGVLGSIEIVQDGGTLKINGTNTDVTLDLKKVEYTLEQISGPLLLTTAESAGTLNTLLSDLELNLENSELMAQVLKGQVSGSVFGGQLGLQRLDGGGRLELSEAPLSVSASEGVLEIDTDADVEVRETRGPLMIRGYGGKVDAQSLMAPVTIETTGSQILLQKVGAQATISGEELELTASDVQGNLEIRSTSSTIKLRDVAGVLDIENDYGDLLIHNASKAITAKLDEGSAELKGIEAPVQLRASGPNVSVSWSQLGHTKDSYVENLGGDLRVELPRKGGCSLNAKTEFGRIESQIPGLEIAEDLNEFNGRLRQGNRPRIEAVADGNIVFAGSPAVAGRPGRRPPTPTRTPQQQRNGNDRD